MQGSEEPAVPMIGSPVLTACGGQIQFEQGTPTAVYRGQRVYFCLPACREDFERDPSISCLADSPLMQGDT